MQHSGCFDPDCSLVGRCFDRWIWQVLAGHQKYAKSPIKRCSWRKNTVYSVRIVIVYFIDVHILYCHCIFLNKMNNFFLVDNSTHFAVCWLLASIRVYYSQGQIPRESVHYVRCWSIRPHHFPFQYNPLYYILYFTSWLWYSPCNTRMWCVW